MQHWATILGITQCRVLYYPPSSGYQSVPLVKLCLHLWLEECYNGQSIPYHIHPLAKICALHCMQYTRTPFFGVCVKGISIDNQVVAEPMTEKRICS